MQLSWHGPWGGRRPLLIRGGALAVFPHLWTLEEVADACSQCQVIESGPSLANLAQMKPACMGCGGR